MKKSKITFETDEHRELKPGHVAVLMLSLLIGFIIVLACIWVMIYYLGAWTIAFAVGAIGIYSAYIVIRDIWRK